MLGTRGAVAVGRRAEAGGVSGQEKLLAALAYARTGWPVHPCKPDSKEPDTAHGFKDATTDEERIRGCGPLYPDRNPAVPTGAPGPDVLDVDVKADGEGSGHSTS